MIRIIDARPRPGHYTLIHHRNGRYTLIVGKYTTVEAAAELGVQPKTVSRYIKRGLIEAEKRGRDYFITAAELERFKAERRGRGRPRNSVG